MVGLITVVSLSALTPRCRSLGDESHDFRSELEIRNVSKCAATQPPFAFDQKHSWSTLQAIEPHRVRHRHAVWLIDRDREADAVLVQKGPESVRSRCVVMFKNTVQAEHDDIRSPK